MDSTRSISPPIRMAIGLIAAGTIGPAIVVWAIGGFVSFYITVVGGSDAVSASAVQILILLIVPPTLALACSRLLWWGADGPVSPRDVPIGIVLAALVGPVLVGLASEIIWDFSVGGVLIPFGFTFVCGLCVTGTSQSIASRWRPKDPWPDGIPILPVLVIIGSVIAMSLGLP